MAHTKEIDDIELLLKPCPFCGSKAKAFKHSGRMKKINKKVRGPFFLYRMLGPGMHTLQRQQTRAAFVSDGRRAVYDSAVEQEA